MRREHENAPRIEPPGPSTLNPLGFLGPVRQDVISFLGRVAAEYGDVAGFRVGPMRVVLVNHPDYINDVLVTSQRNFVKGRPLELAKNLLGEGLLTSDGEVHRRQRRMVQPAFHQAKIESYGKVMTDYASRVDSGWRDGETVDIMQEMMRMALGISGRTMLNTDVDADAGKIANAMTSAMSLFDRLSIPLIQVLLRLPLPSSLRFHRARRTLDATVYQIIRARRSDGRDDGDLLSMLMDVRDEQGDGGGMSDRELRDQALIFLLAAYDTTALALTWTWYLLSQNPAAEARLHAELAAVLDGRIPAIADIPRLKYTHAVFAEAMRLFPPGYVLARRALADFHVGGFFIRRGTTILVSPYLIHRDPRFYDQPETFRPERWACPTSDARPKFCYFPFGGGARTCVGESFSWTEGVLVLATLAQRWKFRLAPGQPVAYLPLLNLRPKYGMRLTLERRAASRIEGSHGARA
jgi:cytochrome P450